MPIREAESKRPYSTVERENSFKIKVEAKEITLKS